MERARGVRRAFSVRECQRGVLLALLEQPRCAWKLAVFDARGGEVLALCLRPRDLARCGVTLAQRLEDAARPRVVGVPCVYVVVPAAETSDAVARDLAPAAAGGRYDAAVVGVLGSADEHAVAALAEALHRHHAARAFRSLVALNADFLSLADTLFVTGAGVVRDPSSATYCALRDPALTDARAKALTDAIAERLFCAVATLGVVPVIRAQAATAAEAVARTLHTRLQEHMRERQASSSSETTATAAAAAQGVCGCAHPDEP